MPRLSITPAPIRISRTSRRLALAPIPTDSAAAKNGNHTALSRAFPGAPSAQHFSASGAWLVIALALTLPSLRDGPLPLGEGFHRALPLRPPGGAIGGRRGPG